MTTAIASSPAFAEAVVRKLTFRSADAIAFAIDLLKTALAKPADAPWFGADEVKAVDHYTTSGCVTGALVASHIIEAWFGNKPEADIWGGRRRSSNPDANGRKVQLYTLRSREEAARLIAQWAADPRLRRLDPQATFDLPARGLAEVTP